MYAERPILLYEVSVEPLQTPITRIDYDPFSDAAARFVDKIVDLAMEELCFRGRHDDGTLGRWLIDFSLPDSEEEPTMSALEVLSHLAIDASEGPEHQAVAVNILTFSGNQPQEQELLAIKR